MGKQSDYYKNDRNQKIIKYRELRDQLPNYVIDFLDDKERSCQINTVIAYSYDLLTFFNYLIEKNPMLKGQSPKDVPIFILNNLEFRDINEFQDYLELNIGENNHSNSHSGINRRMAAVRGMFLYGCQHNIFKQDPTAGASKRQKEKEHIITRLTDDEVEKVMDEVYSPAELSERSKIYCKKSQYRDLAIMSLFLGTGIRVSELVGLDIKDFDFNEKSFQVVRKGGKEMILYFNDDVCDALLNYIECERPKIEDDALFLSNRKQRISVHAVENIVTKYSSNATSKRITPHKLRSTFGTALYHSSNGDIKLVADTLGHSDVNTTSKNYIDSSDEHRRIAGKIDLYNKKDS